jgi:hypothetical protein
MAIDDLADKTRARPPATGLGRRQRLTTTGQWQRHLPRRRRRRRTSPKRKPYDADPIFTYPGSAAQHPTYRAD